MDIAKISNWVQAIGVIGVVASLVFVGIEVRQSGRSAMDASLSSDSDVIVSVEELVTQNPDAWYRGCRGDKLQPADEVVFTHTFHAYEFLYYLRWLRAERGVAASNSNISIDNMAAAVHRNPGLRRLWEDHAKARYHMPDDIPFQRWRVLVDARLDEFVVFEPVPLQNFARCGLN
jgi:hypothetical protein